MSTPIKIAQSNGRDYVVIRPEGSLTARNILDVRNAFEETVKKTFKIVVDLSSVDHMDSMGVGILINLHRRMKGKGGQMAILNPSDVARDILDIADIGRLMPIHSADTDPATIFA